MQSTHDNRTSIESWFVLYASASKILTQNYSSVSQYTEIDMIRFSLISASR